MKTQVKRLEELEQLKEGVTSFIRAKLDLEGIYTVEGKQYSGKEFEERFLRSNNSIVVTYESPGCEPEFTEEAKYKVMFWFPDNGRRDKEK